jgi:hypothetical protein
MRVVIAGLMLLLAAAPAAETKTTSCKSRCQIQYNFCLKRTTTQKGRTQCKAMRTSCQRTCK